MVKGKYGPTVEFKAEGEASWQRKSKEAESTANEVAREVTQKASEKITERVLKRETLRVNRQVEETNQHTFDNALGYGPCLRRLPVGEQGLRGTGLQLWTAHRL